jgi:hypothetical protein
MPSCPFCDGEVGASAQKCRHCGEWLTTPPGAQDPIRVVGADAPSKVFRTVTIALLLLAAVIAMVWAYSAAYSGVPN